MEHYGERRAQQSEFTLLNCHVQTTMANYSVIFNPQGNIHSFMPTGTNITSGSLHDKFTAFMTQWHNQFQNWAWGSSGYGDEGIDSQPVSLFDWPGLLLLRLHQQTEPNSSLLETSVLQNHVRTIYGQTFSTYMGTYYDQYLVNITDPAPAPDGLVYSRTLRMTPSIPLFAIAFVIVALYAVVFVILFFTRRNRFTGPRMPNSVGALIPWIVHSKMARDFEGTHQLSSRERGAYLKRLDKRYRFGEFVGADGTVRLALDQEPLLRDEMKRSMDLHMDARK